MVKSNTLSILAKELGIPDYVNPYVKYYPGRTITGDPEQDLQLHNIITELKQRGIEQIPAALADYMLAHNVIKPTTPRMVVRAQQQKNLEKLMTTVSDLNLEIRKNKGQA